MATPSLLGKHESALNKNFFAQPPARLRGLLRKEKIESRAIGESTRLQPPVLTRGESLREEKIRLILGVMGTHRSANIRHFAIVGHASSGKRAALPRARQSPTTM
jgi:hypothetical protein